MRRIRILVLRFQCPYLYVDCHTAIGRGQAYAYRTTDLRYSKEVNSCCNLALVSTVAAGLFRHRGGGVHNGRDVVTSSRRWLFSCTDRHRHRWIQCVSVLDAVHRALFSPPGYATIRLRPANQLHFLLYANAVWRISPELSSVDQANKNWLPRQTFVEGSNN